MEDIIEIMERENCNKAIFIGHSQGGQIAQELAYRCPEKVEKLILIGSNCNTKKLTISEKLAMSLAPILVKFYPWVFLIKHNRKTGSIYMENQKYVQDCYRVMGKKDYTKIVIETQKAFHFEKYYNLNKSILFLYGEYDKTFYTKKALKYWSQVKNNCQCYMIRNAAHNSNQDNPISANIQIVQFLKKKAPPLI